MQTGPLSGITVVDCSRAVAGPYAAMLLGLAATLRKSVRQAVQDDEFLKGRLPSRLKSTCRTVRSSMRSSSATAAG